MSNCVPAPVYLIPMPCLSTLKSVCFLSFEYRLILLLYEIKKKFVGTMLYMMKYLFLKSVINKMSGPPGL